MAAAFMRHDTTGEIARKRVLVFGATYLGVDLAAVWLVVEQDLPALTEAVDRMAKALTQG